MERAVWTGVGRRLAAGFLIGMAVASGAHAYVFPPLTDPGRAWSRELARLAVAAARLVAQGPVLQRVEVRRQQLLLADEAIVAYWLGLIAQADAQRLHLPETSERVAQLLLSGTRREEGFESAFDLDPSALNNASIVASRDVSQPIWRGSVNRRAIYARTAGLVAFMDGVEDLSENPIVPEELAVQTVVYWNDIVRRLKREHAADARTFREQLWLHWWIHYEAILSIALTQSLNVPTGTTAAQLARIYVEVPKNFMRAYWSALEPKLPGLIESSLIGSPNECIARLTGQIDPWVARAPIGRDFVIPLPLP